MQWMLYVLGVYLAGCYLWGMYMLARLWLGRRPERVARVRLARWLPRRRPLTSAADAAVESDEPGEQRSAAGSDPRGPEPVSTARAV